MDGYSAPPAGENCQNRNEDDEFRHEPPPEGDPYAGESRGSGEDGDDRGPAARHAADGASALLGEHGYETLSRHTPQPPDQAVRQTTRWCGWCVKSGGGLAWSGPSPMDKTASTWPKPYSCQTSQGACYLWRQEIRVKMVDVNIYICSNLQRCCTSHPVC